MAVSVDRERIEEIAQMACAPSDAFPAGAWCEATNVLLAALAALEADNERLRRALKHIKFNAESWHGPEGLDTGHARSLGCIAEWAEEALASRPGEGAA